MLDLQSTHIYKWIKVTKVASKKNHCVYKERNPNSMFEKANYVWMKEHVFVKNICGVPYDVFDPGGKSTKLSIRNKIDF